MDTLALSLASLAPLALALLSLWLITAARSASPVRLAPAVPLAHAEAAHGMTAAQAAAARSLAQAEAAARSLAPSPFTLTVSRSLRPLADALVHAPASLVYLSEADTEREALMAADALALVAGRLSSAASVMDARSVAEPLVMAAETLASAGEEAATLMELSAAEADTLRRYVCESRIKAAALIASAQRDTAPAPLAGSLITEGK